MKIDQILILVFMALLVACNDTTGASGDVISSEEAAVSSSISSVEVSSSSVDPLKDAKEGRDGRVRDDSDKSLGCLIQMAVSATEICYQFKEGFMTEEDCHTGMNGGIGTASMIKKCPEDVVITCEIEFGSEDTEYEVNYYGDSYKKLSKEQLCPQSF